MLLVCVPARPSCSLFVGFFLFKFEQPQICTELKHEYIQTRADTHHAHTVGHTAYTYSHVQITREVKLSEIFRRARLKRRPIDQDAKFRMVWMTWMAMTVASLTMETGWLEPRITYVYCEGGSDNEGPDSDTDDLCNSETESDEENDINDVRPPSLGFELRRWQTT